MRLSKFLPLIGITIFIYIVLATGPNKIIASLEKIKPLYFILSLLVIPPLIVLKAIKWRMIIKTYEVDYPLINSMKAWIVGFAIGIITPGRVGDLTRSFYLKEEEEISLGRSLTTVVVDRILDLALLIIWAIMGITIFISIFALGETFLFVFIVAFIVLASGILIFTKEELLRRILKPFYSALAPEKYKSDLSNHFNEFYMGFRTIIKKKKELTYAIFVTILIWFGSIVQFYLLAKALNLVIPFWYFLIIVPPTILVEVLPISFSGLGTRDATLIFFLSFISITAESAVSLSITIVVIYYIIVSIGFIIWWKNPIRF